jgi:ribonuclease VapC
VIIDSSAVLAILFAEPDAEIYARAIAEADVCHISAVNYVEVSIVVETQTRDEGVRHFNAFFQRAAISIDSASVEQAHAARQAYSEFGKGRHPAGLNLGDCFAYALAKTTGEPLLFKGNDFSKTDIPAAV